MPRRPRIQAAGALYHVTQRATGVDVLFLDRADHMVFEQLLVKVARRYRWQIHDYCELSTHFHLVVLTREPTIAAGMQYLNARHVERFNRRHDRGGTLVQGRYYAGLITSERHYLVARAYLALNPVAAGLCARPVEWPWGGYGGRGRIVPEPSARLQKFVSEYAAHRQTRADLSRSA